MNNASGLRRKGPVQASWPEELALNKNLTFEGGLV
jgi:hypothetical protein